MKKFKRAIQNCLKYNITGADGCYKH